MDNYVVKLYAQAYRDLDGIYSYIANELLEPNAAINLVNELEGGNIKSRANARQRCCASGWAIRKQWI